MPLSVEDWLPQRHLARFVVEVVDGLDLRAMSGACRRRGQPFPATCYCTMSVLSLNEAGMAMQVKGSGHRRRLNDAP
jgi:hypothetical protein